MEDSDLVEKRKRLKKERSESCFKRNGPDTIGPPGFELEPSNISTSATVERRQ